MAEITGVADQPTSKKTKAVAASAEAPVSAVVPNATVSESKAAPEAPAPAAVSAAPVTETTAVALPKFRVVLNANTPLAQTDMTIEASGEEEAWGKFCDANGISGSDCPRTITRV